MVHFSYTNHLFTSITNDHYYPAKHHHFISITIDHRFHPLVTHRLGRLLGSMGGAPRKRGAPQATHPGRASATKGGTGLVLQCFTWRSGLDLGISWVVGFEPTQAGLDLGIFLGSVRLDLGFGFWVWSGLVVNRCSFRLFFTVKPYGTNPTCKCLESSA